MGLLETALAEQVLHWTDTPEARHAAY